LLTALRQSESAKNSSRKASAHGTISGLKQENPGALSKHTDKIFRFGIVVFRLRFQNALAIDTRQASI
jgi:hypothetical protein